MADHDSPASGIGVLGCLNRLCQSTNLVDFQEQGVASLQLDGFLDAQWIRDCQVIATEISSIQISIEARKSVAYPTI